VVYSKTLKYDYAYHFIKEQPDSGPSFDREVFFQARALNREHVLHTSLRSSAALTRNSRLNFLGSAHLRSSSGVNP